MIAKLLWLLCSLDFEPEVVDEEPRKKRSQNMWPLNLDIELIDRRERPISPDKRDLRSSLRE